MKYGVQNFTKKFYNYQSHNLIYLILISIAFLFLNEFCLQISLLNQFLYPIISNMSSSSYQHATDLSHAKIHDQLTDKNQNDTSLDLTFEKMQKLGIPADMFGNINPNWRVVMKNYFDGDKQDEEKVDQQFEKTIDSIGRACSQKYGSDSEKVEDCHEQAQLKIINHFKKPKDLSQILLCNFANKCLIRGNSIQFCTEEVLKEKKVINRECLKKLQGIEQFL